MEKYCWSCGNFRPFYTKGFCCFTKTDYGTCSLRTHVKEKHETCEFWRMRPHSYPVKNAVIVRSLEEALVHIAAIKEILEDKK